MQQPTNQQATADLNQQCKVLAKANAVSATTAVTSHGINCPNCESELTRQELEDRVCFDCQEPLPDYLYVQ